ncbi:hypothetical protein JMJ77_0002280, partial [Colletotrichum scovillei]
SVYIFQHANHRPLDIDWLLLRIPQLASLRLSFVGGHLMILLSLYRGSPKASSAEEAMGADGELGLARCLWQFPLTICSRPAVDFVFSCSRSHPPRPRCHSDVDRCAGWESRCSNARIRGDIGGTDSPAGLRSTPRKPRKRDHGPCF